MILVTVGTQLPFERLVKAIDHLALTLSQPVIAQIANGALEPKNMEAHQHIEADQFEELASHASLLVSHAGIGSVLLARRLNKPIVIMPRRAGLGEHRNDHQIGTARKLEGAPNVFVAWEADDLSFAISSALNGTICNEEPGASLHHLQEAVSHFIARGTLPEPGNS